MSMQIEADFATKVEPEFNDDRSATRLSGAAAMSSQETKPPSDKVVETLRHERGHAQEHPDGRVPSRDDRRRSRARRIRRGGLRRKQRATATSTRSWSGAARTSRTGPTWSCNAPPLYIQEKVHPKVLIDDLLRQSRERREGRAPAAARLFADFNGLPDRRRQDRVLPARPELDQPHDPGRQPAGDGEPGRARRPARQGAVHLPRPALWHQVQLELPVVHDQPRREGRQRATTSRREPEQVKAFRDTWRDGIHSYLTYLRDRLTVARDLLTDSGSVFVQIGDENVHRVRALMDEVFGDDNFVAQIAFKKTTASTDSGLLAAAS